MAHSPDPVEIDPQALERAEHMWSGFMSASKLAIAVTLIVLAILTLLFIA